MFGLPPSGVLLAHYLKDGALLEFQPSFLTWDGAVFFRVVVKKCFQKHLDVLTMVGKEGLTNKVTVYVKLCVSTKSLSL